MAFRSLRSPTIGSSQYTYELYNQCAKLTDYLYLSSHNASQQTEKVRRLRFTAEVNVTPALPFTDLDIDKMRIAVSDISSVKIHRYFQEFIRFVNQHRHAGGRVLVYCECGVSRSATLCIIYLITMERMDLFDAYAHIKLIRGIINPNEGFWQQMSEYEQSKTGKSTVKLEKFRNFRDFGQTYY